ncbi:MAG TPA: Yip1 family protein [Casimicrobiaceae bacterium]|nr:Yip1 family protein [Casimicrobiaceae bacterium]
MLARIKGILVSPKTEWPIIAAEPSSAGAIYLGYVAPLAAIGVIAGLIGHTLLGHRVLGLGLSVGLGLALVKYLLTFVSVFVVAWLVDLLAPTFGGQRDSLRALKVTAYSYTPAWVAGILLLLPGLAVLAILAGLYGLYLLYVGLPVLMRNPADKSLGYTVLLVICAIVVSVAISFLSTCVIAGAGLAGIGALGRLGSHAESNAGADAAGTIASIFGGKSDADKARVGEAISKLQKMGEDAERQAKSGAPSSSGSDADLTAALSAVGTIASGGKNVEPVDFRKLKELLPETLAGMKRSEATGQSGEAMGIKGSSATARYTDGGSASMNVEITDMGSLSGLAGLASRFDPKMEKETDTGYERTSKVNGQIVHERYDRRARSGEINVILGERFNVAVRGNGVDAATMQAAIKEIDLSGIVALAK